MNNILNCPVCSRVAPAGLTVNPPFNCGCLLDDETRSYGWMFYNLRAQLAAAEEKCDDLQGDLDFHSPCLGERKLEELHEIRKRLAQIAEVVKAALCTDGNNCSNPDCADFREILTLTDLTKGDS